MKTVTVELSYEMAKLAGCAHLTMYNVRTVADLVEQARTRVGPDFDKEARLSAVAVNGVLVNHKRGMKTKLEDGDIVSFVKAAAGG